MAKKEEKSVRVVDPFDRMLEAWPFREPAPLSRLLEETWGRRGSGGFVPAVDISEDDDRYVVTVEVPGATKDDVTVEMHENVMTIRGEKKSEREGKKEQNRWVERTYGSFSRSFSLPGNADSNKINALFKDGVLTVEVAKREEAKPKVIAIK